MAQAQILCSYSYAKMKKYTIEDLQKLYDIDFEAIEEKIKSKNPKVVLLQFPDGLKQYSLAVKNRLEKKFPKIIFMIWLGSCFGACDVPHLEGEADLIIQFGHSEWKRK